MNLEVPAILTRGLTRWFGPVRAVDGLCLEVEAGTVFGFLGPNGAGKTTTLRLLLGLIEPSGGEARVLGHDVRTAGQQVRALCGALLEHDGLYERLSARDNLDLIGRIWHMRPAEREARTRGLLERIGLWDRRDERIRGWSRGMRQKLAVARALYHRPRLAFLDEPTSGLDPVAAAELVEDIRRLVEQEGLTVFLTTHHLAEAEKLCGRIGVIRRGELVACGSPAELRSRAGGRRVEITASGVSEVVLDGLRERFGEVERDGRTGRLTVTLRGTAPAGAGAREAGQPKRFAGPEAAGAAPLVRYLVEHGAEVEEVRLGTASLEEAFLALVREEREESEG